MAITPSPCSPTSSKAALLPTTAIFYSIECTAYLNPPCIGSSLGCLAFADWGFMVASKGVDLTKQHKRRSRFLANRTSVLIIPIRMVRCIDS